MVIDTKLYLVYFSLVTLTYPLVTLIFLKPFTNNKTVFKIFLFLICISWLLLISDLFNILMVWGFYVILKRHPKDYFTLQIILISTILCNLTYYLSESLLKLSLYSLSFLGGSEFVGSSLLLNFLLLTLFVFLGKKYSLIALIKRQNTIIFTLLTIYLYMVIRIVIFLSAYFKFLNSAIVLINGILIIQSIFTIVLFLIISNSQKKKYDFKLLKKQFDILNEYTKELEYSQEVNAKFKHDYKNLLLSLKSSIENEGSSELINTISELEQYSNSYFKKIEVDFRHCQNIKNDYLKSLIISKLSKAKQKEIDCHLECQMMIDKIPIDQFDCVRMFGIVLDNAIEAAVETVNPRIDIMLYQNDDQLEFWVKNNYAPNNLDLKALKRANVSTKEGHSGLGLDNIEEISQKHPNILKTFSKKEDIFSANIKILFN